MSDTAVAGANQVSEKAVEGLESVVASAGLVKPVSSFVTIALHILVEITTVAVVLESIQLA